MNKKTYVIITGKSESGDDYGPWLFEEKPTQKSLEKFIRKNCPQEFPEDEDGYGDFGSCLYLTIHENVNILKIK